jgi:hypothetical protein
MNIVRSFAAEDATIIYGGVYDDALAEDLRVTVVATGLGMAQQARQQKPNRNRPRARAGRLPAARPGAGGDPAQPRLDRGGAAAKRRRQVRHPGVSQEAGGLAPARSQATAPNLAGGGSNFPRSDISFTQPA